MLYRLYSPADFERLYALEKVCFQPPLRFSRAYMRSLIDAADSATWIAEDDGAMAGFAIVEWTRDAARTIAYIQTIEVDPAQRGCGVGTELLRRMEQSARAAGSGSIWLHVDAENRPALGLYQSHGYLCEGEVQGYYGEGTVALRFRKSFPV